MTPTKFTERIYLGKYHGEKVYLAPPSWDCGWYWGFGYIQNRNLHTHYNCVCLTKVERYDFEKAAWTNGEYIDILSGNPDFTELAFTEPTLWALSDYMKSFYALQKAAEVLGRGSSHMAGSAKPCVLDQAMAERINTELLPKLFDTIFELLTEKENTHVD